MFGKGENYSTQRIVDPVSGVRVPVVLNPKMEIADPQLPARERVNLYVRFIKAQGTRYCLFTPTGLKVSRVAGVSLSSQIEHMAVVYQLEDETIIAQFGQTYYLANLASGFVIREELVPIEQFDSNDLGQNEVIALQGVKGANEMGIRIIDATLLLRGRGVTKAHLFQTETKAFSAAGYRHPAQIRRLIISVVLILTLLVSLYFYRAYQSEQERIEQQKRAAVIPPKVGKDSSVEQFTHIRSSSIEKYSVVQNAYRWLTIQCKIPHAALQWLLNPEHRDKYYALTREQFIREAIEDYAQGHTVTS